MRKLIRTDGTEEEICHPIAMKEIKKNIGADTLACVLLKDRIHVMLVDDLGYAKGLTVNEKATELYYEKCGGPNPHQIRGDVVIVPDEDFA